MHLTKIVVVSALFAVSVIPMSAFSDENVSIPFKDVIQAKAQEIRDGKVAGYRLAWGAPNPEFEGIIARSAPKKGLLDTIESARDDAKRTNSFAGVNQSCVLNVIVNNNGAYQSYRTCTSIYADRNYMNSTVYPGGYTVYATFGNVDYGRDPTGVPFSVFYTPTGHASEMAFLYNSTN